ncbi:MAG: hypothetical protein ABIX28_17560 [Vicinamibacterales bacterium]
MRPSVLRLVGCVVLLLGAGSGQAAAQQPVVFIHGVASGPDTWQETADRLQDRLEITAQRAEVSWWSSIEHQGGEMQNRFGDLPNSTIAVGHSLGGLVARQWSRSHELDGIITIGAPNRGAPIANHINEWAGFNVSLFNAVGTAFSRLSGLSYDQWWWVSSAVQGALNWGGALANFSLSHLFLELGMQYGTPFVQEVYVGSPYLEALNGDGWEAANVPSRVGIVNTASEYWRGGPFRLKNPDYAGEFSILTSTAAAGLDYWAFRVLADADPLDLDAQSFAHGLLDAAFYLWNFDEFWCRATSDDRPIWSGHCLPNDGFIPAWSQFYSGAVTLEVNGGPVHTQETNQLGDYIYASLTNFMHVPERGREEPDGGGPGTGPGSGGGGGAGGGGGSPGGGAGSMSPDQSIYAGGSIQSGNGRFSLVYQGDGNLVLYRSDGRPLWASQTSGRSAGRTVMQMDGNLVVYDAGGTPIWASGTSGYGGASLLVQDDGNVVIYAASGAPLWASGTSGS